LSIQSPFAPFFNKVLIASISPPRVESKWFGPYQVAQKMLLGTYRLQDPNRRELATFMHGNRLIRANIRTESELRDLLASPKAKDKLRKRNRNLELLLSYAMDTDILDQYLQDNDEDDHDLEEMDLEIGNVMPRRNLKRKREIFEEIIVQRGPPPDSS
jgi:hypothetical protein